MKQVLGPARPLLPSGGKRQAVQSSCVPAFNPMRRIRTMHCVFAFFFNTTILALTVNLGAGFF